MVKVCPRCGLEYSYIERRVIGGRVYLYAVHVTRVREGGRVKRRVRKCYLGPEDSYEYVSMLHEREGIRLRGLVKEDRALEYFDTLLSYVIDKDLNKELALKLISKLKEVIKVLEEKYLRG